jgi:hypothetical protein
MYRRFPFLGLFLIPSWICFLRQGVPNLGAESGVSVRTRLLPGTLAHALVVIHNALPPGHETSHNG